jgi:hypothetical protein
MESVMDSYDPLKALSATALALALIAVALTMKATYATASWALSLSQLPATALSRSWAMSAMTVKYVTLDYSFEYIGIASNNNLFLWDTATGVLAQNTDPDLGIVLDTVWVDGYWMTTDGEFLVVTELRQPVRSKPVEIWFVRS